MANIIAKFSNGFEDVYKGNRPVKAAWAVIRKSDGEVIMSGHSLDRVKAAKTASGNMVYIGGYGPRMPTRYYPGVESTYRRYGYDGNRSSQAMTRWARDWNAARRARIEADHIVEVVDL